MWSSAGALKDQELRFQGIECGDERGFALYCSPQRIQQSLMRDGDPEAHVGVRVVRRDGALGIGLYDAQDLGRRFILGEDKETRFELQENSHGIRGKRLTTRAGIWEAAHGPCRSFCGLECSLLHRYVHPFFLLLVYSLVP
ncbi:hypothetical protein KDH_12260 [Dictyobacter sp. S3.2.2.5]|uniref:Uncharacterized protein n=1 Tax=Dictyobacter halimunensis TaxID=3026934 RepID=A0ABQ6FPN3_9CHLR|nr:hypothetical protein KDH_12260 [Dictyobacter sp. S3.2.2.5]